MNGSEHGRCSPSNQRVPLFVLAALLVFLAMDGVVSAFGRSNGGSVAFDLILAVVLLASAGFCWKKATDT